MKIAKKKLQDIIKEEITNVLKEIDLSEPVEAGTFMNVRTACGPEGNKDDCEAAQQAAKDVGATQFAAAATPLVATGAKVGLSVAKANIAGRAAAAIIKATETATSVFTKVGGTHARQAVHAAYRTVSKLLSGPNAIGSGAVRIPFVAAAGGHRRARQLADTFLKQIFNGRRKFTQDDLKQILAILNKTLKSLK